MPARRRIYRKASGAATQPGRSSDGQNGERPLHSLSNPVRSFGGSMTFRGRFAPLAFAIAIVASGAFSAFLSAATYLPLSVTELPRRAPSIVRARVLSQVLRHRTLLDSGADSLSTATTLRVLETIHGTAL